MLVDPEESTGNRRKAPPADEADDESGPDSNPLAAASGADVPDELPALSLSDPL